MEKLNIQFHDTLNPDLWDGSVLKPEVKEALLKIAEEFVNFLKVDAQPLDVLFLGSNANYNYTKNSDIDLNPVLDYSKINEDKELVKRYFDSKKIIWNDQHDIKIFGYEVQIYVLDIDEEHTSGASYSIVNDKWLKVPDKVHPQIDVSTVLRKAKDLIKHIESSKGNYDALTSLKDKIISMRKSGLARGGEFSTENLVYKALSANKTIDKLFDYAHDAYDKELSLKEFQLEWNELNK